MVRILAIDCATTTGWAAGDSAGNPVSGAVTFGPDRDGKYSGIMQWTHKMLKEHEPERIAIEAPFVGDNTSFSQMELAYGMQACILAVCRYKTFLKVKQHNVNSIQSYFIPKPPIAKGEKRPKLGSDQKKMLIRRRCIELGWTTEEETSLDQTDACAIWAYAVGLYDQPNSIRFSPLFTKV
jgi:hypothetical protein